ncbi:MAG: hypothetical protein JWM40_2213 [Frankiales bacterium]|nr:hypothetical protein [Frankiales bacterium]
MRDMSDGQSQPGPAGTRISALLAWRPLESWQTVLAAGLAVFTAAAVSVFVAAPDPASTVTIVSQVTRAEIVLADGSQRSATIGARLPNGAVLRTGQGGGARLTTGARDVYVGAGSTLAIIDGVHQTLERGQVMVNATDGPALTLATTAGAGTVSTPVGTLARVEQNVSTLRLAVYRGAASITAEGRSASSTVTALHQVRAPYGGVPGPQTALALTLRNGVHDQWEQSLVADLVQSDIDLNSFATALDGADGQVVIDAAPISLRESTLQGRLGERALTVAVAQKARLFQQVDANLARVERDRGDGGSWGVVAAIVRANVTDVTGVLGSSLNDPATPTLVALPTPRTPSTSSSGPSTPTTDPTTPTRRPTRRPTPSPSPGTVDDTVKQVTGLLPPVPTPSPSVAAPVPAPPPTLATILRGLLGPLSP